MSQDPFQRDLEAVFGERAADLTGDTRRLLKQLWREGDKHGRSEVRQGVPVNMSATIIPAAGTTTTQAAGTMSFPNASLAQLKKMFDEGVLLLNRPRDHAWLDSATEFAKISDASIAAEYSARRTLFGDWSDPED
jgi:hypothetical protein